MCFSLLSLVDPCCFTLASIECRHHPLVVLFFLVMVQSTMIVCETVFCSIKRLIAPERKRKSSPRFGLRVSEVRSFFFVNFWLSFQGFKVLLYCLCFRLFSMPLSSYSIHMSMELCTWNAPKHVFSSMRLCVPVLNAPLTLSPPSKKPPNFFGVSEGNIFWINSTFRKRTSALESAGEGHSGLGRHPLLFGFRSVVLACTTEMSRR